MAKQIVMSNVVLSLVLINSLLLTRFLSVPLCARHCIVADVHVCNI